MKHLIALSIGGDGQPSYQINSPSLAGINSLRLQDLIQKATVLILYVAIILSFLFVVFAGFKWMMSQGDKKAIDEAQKTFTYAIVGLIIAFLSFFIVNIIGYAFGVPLLGR